MEANTARMYLQPGCSKKQSYLVEAP